MILVLLLNVCGLMARGGHGGHHSGGHHGGHHTGHHSGHHFAHRGGHHAYHGYGRGYGWRTGWAWGRPGWRWGATGALIAGSFLFGGYTYSQWQRMAQQDPEKRYYFETVVLPAYKQYQQNPNSIVAVDNDGDASMTDQDDTSPMEIETYIDVYQNEYVPIRRCCTDASSNWLNAGPDREWREQNIAPDNFSIYQRSEYRPVSFPDLSEQPQISGFETSVYTSPK